MLIPVVLIPVDFFFAQSEQYGFDNDVLKILKLFNRGGNDYKYKYFSVDTIRYC